MGTQPYFRSQAGYIQLYGITRPFDWVLTSILLYFTEFRTCFTEFRTVFLSLGPVLLRID